MIPVNAGQCKVHYANPFQIHGNRSEIYVIILLQSNLLRTCPSACALWYSFLESLATDKLWHLGPLVFVNLFFYNASHLLMTIVTATQSIDNGVRRVIFIGHCFCCCSSNGKTIYAMPFDIKMMQSTIVSSNVKGSV